MDFFVDPLYIALYPEIHYTFDLFFSRLRHSQPEIVADAPYRLDPGQPLPLVCIIKHADRYPVHLQAITATLSYDDGQVAEHRLLTTPLPVHQYLWHDLFNLHLRDGYAGDLGLTARIDYTCNGRRRSIINHNYRGADRRPLRIFAASEPLPAGPGWHYGESHCHSFSSDDQIEFGAPLGATAAMARAMGLSWLAVTDHSYDLDDLYGQVLRHDATLSKWIDLKRDVEQENDRGQTVVILGEEISCGNARRKNIHVLAYGIQQFIPGCGDGAERWFRTQPSLPLRDVLQRIGDDGGIAYAAHPEERFSLAERIMLRRGRWEDDDYQQPGYSGLQFWNGRQDRSFHRGYRRWVELLLEGRRVFFVGGDDAHGDFNIFRQIRIPLLKMIAVDYKVFGRVRTGLLCRGKPNRESVLAALRDGNSIVTSGPFLTAVVHNERGESATIGQTITGQRIDLHLTARSSEEFGPVREMTLITGSLKDKTEMKRAFHLGSDFHDGCAPEVKGVPITADGPLYLRLEAGSARQGTQYQAYTNPIWIQAGSGPQVRS